MRPGDAGERAVGYACGGRLPGSALRVSRRSPAGACFTILFTCVTRPSPARHPRVTRHSDPGILKYADVDAVVAAATQAPQKLIAKYSQ